MNVRRLTCATIAAAALTFGSTGCAPTQPATTVTAPAPAETQAPATTPPAATEAPTTEAQTTPDATTQPGGSETVEAKEQDKQLEVDKVTVSIVDVSWGGESPDSNFQVKVCASDAGGATQMGRWTYEGGGKKEQPGNYKGEDALPLETTIEPGKCVEGWITFPNGPETLVYTAPSGDVGMWHTRGW